MESIIKNKKGILGLDTAKLVFVWFLVLAIIAIAILLALPSLRDVTEDIDTTTVSVTAEALSGLNGTTPVNLAYLADDQYRGSVCSSHVATNASGGETIASSNYTLSNSDCSIIAISNSEYNNTEWNIAYTAVYANPGTNNIVGNISLALSEDFFDQTGTVLAILIVVVIILAIGIIIAVVVRFQSGASDVTGGTIGSGGKSSGMNGMMGGSKSSYGSDTLMGI